MTIHFNNFYYLLKDLYGTILGFDWRLNGRHEKSPNEESPIEKSPIVGKSLNSSLN